MKTLLRLSSAADLLRPRTFFRTLARVDQVADATRELAQKLEEVRIRTDQLMAIERLNWEQQKDLDRLSSDLDATRIGEHIRRAVATASLDLEPFPHIVVDEWLPRPFYDIVIRARRPIRVGGPRLRRNVLPHPRRLLRASPAVGRADHAASPRIRHPAAPRSQMGLHHRPGLPGPAGRQRAYGTQLYRLRNENEAPNDKPLFVDDRQCELVKAVPFRPNTLLAFLNSTHGASIPWDATPASLERYVYQFRLGPDGAAIKRLMAAMPAERRQLWSGAKAEGAWGLKPGASS